MKEFKLDTKIILLVISIVEILATRELDASVILWAGYGIYKLLID